MLHIPQPIALAARITSASSFCDAADGEVTAEVRSRAEMGFS